MFLLSFGILNWIILQQTPNVDAENGLCTDWKLYGGRAKYEGMVMVNNNNTDVNLCNNTNLTVQEICKKIDKTWLDVQENVTYVGNVFDVSLKDKAISSCTGNSRIIQVCGADDTGDCCKPVGVCCLGRAATEVCSAPWSKIYGKYCHYSKGSHNNYTMTKSFEFSGDFSAHKAWTKSALSFNGLDAQQCLDTGGRKRKDVLKLCAYKCLNNDTSSVTNSTDNCICTLEDEVCNCTHIVNSSECKFELEVLSTKPNNIRQLDLCIAGTVKDGTVIFSAEDCDLFLQPLCFKIPEKGNPNSNATDDKRNQDSNATDDKPKVDTITTPIIIACVVGLIILVIIPLICKCRTCGSKRESFRSRSMYNKTYGRQLQRQQFINDEEYAIISEIELDSGTSCFKPRLPERNNLDPAYNTIGHDENKQRADIITLDEYSSPSDMIKGKDVKYDPASEYTTTYDDPVRHNEETIVENKAKSEVKDTLENRELETDKPSPEPHDDDNKVSESYESIAGDKNSDDKVMADLGEPEKKTDISLLESAEEEVGECDSPQSKNANNDDVYIDDPAGYEDTNIMDGNFPAKPKHIFEEHVCLHCLKPEHLERLGIRIITEDKALESIENESLIDDSGDDKSLDNSIDSDSNINSEIGRECVICKNVYDNLGNVKKQTVTKSSGNVHEYDKLRNYKESVL